jgi:hypothetical protein
MPRFEHPLTRFSAAARPRAQLWRTLVGAALAFAMVIALSLLARIGVEALVHGPPEGDLKSVLHAALRASAAPRTTLSTLIALASFAAFWPALWLTTRLVHARSGATLWGPTGRIDWGHFRIGLAISLTLGAAAWLPWMHLTGPGGFEVRALADWLPVLAIGLPLVFVQSASEELLFRGYLLQQLAARTWSILGWSLLPSLLFGMLHDDFNEPLGINWFSFVFGLIMAAVTSRTANLGAAVGMHFGHNIINVLMIAPMGLAMNAALISRPGGVDLRGPNLIYILVMFLGTLIFMARKDMQFLKAWRADPSREGQPPVRLMLPLRLAFIADRRRPETPPASAAARRRAKDG